MSARRLVLSLVVLASSAPDVSAQDHLLPERGSLNDNLGLDHAKSLHETLLKDSAFYYRARVVCLPSGKPAWAVTLTREGDDDHPAYSVEYAVLEGRPGEPIKNARVRREKVPLDPEAAEAVQKVWMRMLREVRYPEKAIGGQADGVTYRFSRFVPYPSDDPSVPPGWEAGNIWTPKPMTSPGRLASLGEEMRAYALAKGEERGKLRERIFKEAVSLEADLAKHH
jgi:hypothetical protein